MSPDRNKIYHEKICHSELIRTLVIKHSSNSTQSHCVVLLHFEILKNKCKRALKITTNEMTFNQIYFCS